MVKNDLIEMLNTGRYAFRDSTFYKYAKQVYYSVTLHTKGARPRFKNLRNNVDIFPPFYFGDEYQYLFENFLFSRHPREAETTRNWRFSQYRARTKRPFLQLIELIGSLIFKQGQYHFECENEDTTKYILSNEFDYRGFNLFEYYHRVLHPAMYEDPNGFIVHIPVPIEDSPVNVSIYHVRVIDVLHFEKDHLVYEKDGLVYSLTKNEINVYKKNEDGKYEEVPGRVYLHNLGFIPACLFGGVWNTEGFFNSFFDKAIPVADDYIGSYSAEQMIDKEASHPYITMAKKTCPTCQGTKTHQIDCETCPNGKELIDCSTCGGTGEISWNPADRYEASKEDMEYDLVKITNPSPEFNKYHHEKNNELMRQILSSLDLLLIDEAQSGAAKALDKENLKLFASTINERLFSRIEFSIKCIIGYRNVKRDAIGEGLVPDFKQFTLLKPISFEIKSEEDLLQEVADAQAGSLPTVVRKKAIIQYVSTRYANDHELIKRTRLTLDFDKLATMTEEEISANQRLSDDDLVMHTDMDSILDEFIDEIKIQEFLKLDYNETKTKFKEFITKRGTEQSE
jgi:hypothetical protein